MFVILYFMFHAFPCNVCLPKGGEVLMSGKHLGRFILVDIIPILFFDAEHFPHIRCLIV